MSQTVAHVSSRRWLFGVSLSLLLVGGCPIMPCWFCDNLIEEAVCRVRRSELCTIVFQVNGVNALNETTGVYETQSYSFFATNPDNATVCYELLYDLTNWTTTVSSMPLMDVAYEDLRDVTMTESEARALLVAAGFEEDFLGWSLYRPAYAGMESALYVFNYGDEVVTVDTETEAVGGQIVSTTPPVSAAPGDDSVSLAMIAAADTRIKQEDPAAIIIWAGGRVGSGESLTSPGDTNVWDFVAGALDANGVTVWRLSYDGEWQVAELPTPPYGIVFLDLATHLTLDVVEAWALVVDAGYDPPFSSWEVFQPLNATAENPIYVFPSSAGYVIVDAATGEVWLETR
ncbi:MAG: hypothetical protein PVJ57_03320 [Phycisphaerae bacterium]|jgi:hypothetical protein